MPPKKDPSPQPPKRSPRLMAKRREKAPVIPEEDRIAALAHLQHVKRPVPPFGASTEVTPSATVPDEPPSSRLAALRILPLPPAESTIDSAISILTSTPVTPEFSKEAHINKRIEDEQFCARHFPGHTSIASSIDGVLELMGGKRILDRYRRACEIARPRVNQGLLDLFRKRMKDEGPGQQDADWILGTYSDGYWINQMADQAAAPNSPTKSLEFVRGDTKSMPAGRVIHSRRKPDAGLICSQVARPPADDQPANEFTWYNLFVLVELTVTSATESQIMALGTKKYRQLITNMVDLLIEQPSRQFAPGFSIHGDHFVFSLLDREGLYHCYIENAVSSESLHQVLALWEVLRSSSVYELGHSPLFHYTFDLPSGNLTADRLIFPSNMMDDGVARTFNIKGPPINQITRIPFHRATAVWELEPPDAPAAEPDRAMYAKLQWVSEDRVGREVAALRQLATAGPLPSWAPKLVAWLVTERLACQLPSDQFNQGDPFGRPTQRIRTARHIEILITETLASAERLAHTGVDTDNIVSLARQLFEAIEFAYKRNILHRDISSGNVLCTPDGRLVWIDWECATPVGSTATSRQRTGTIDTMSVRALEGYSFVHQPHQELESGVYLIWKLTMTNARLLVRKVDESMFKERREKYYWDVPGAPAMVADSRKSMWGDEVLIELPFSAVGSTGQDLIRMAKSLPVEVFLIHGWSQIPALSPRKLQMKGLSVQERFESGLSAILAVIDEVDANGKTWAVDLGIA